MSKGQKSITLSELATLVNGEVVGDPHIRIFGVSTIFDGAPGHLVFAEDERKLDQAQEVEAAVLLIPKELKEKVELGTKALLIVENGRLGFAKVLAYFAPEYPLPVAVHPAAKVSPQAKLGRDVRVHAGAVIEAGAEIGAGTWVYPNVYIAPDVKIGEDCLIYPNAVIHRLTTIGDRVIIQAGAVIGSDGFGFVTAGGKHHKIPHIGEVEIGSDVEIGANACIDRGTVGKTVIGVGTKIDNLVQIGHNVQLGQHNLLAGMSGVAGSAITEDYVTLAGQSGVAGHLTVSQGTIVGAGAIVAGDIKEPGFISGVPARPHREEMRAKASLRRVPDLIRNQKELERRIAELEELVEKLSSVQ